MNKFYKKLSIIFVMAFAIMLGSFTNVLAVGETQSIKINNTTLDFNKIIYVTTSGNDTTGDGSETNPFLTFDKAYQSASDNSAIVLGDGTFKAINNVPDYIISTKNISILGNANKTTLVFPSSKGQHHTPTGTIKFYRLTLTFDSSNYAGFCGDGVSPAVASVYFYNVNFIDNVNSYPIAGGNYTPVGYPSRYNFYIYNSNFQLQSNEIYANLTLINSSINKSSFGSNTVNPTILNQNSLYNVTYDSNGAITSNGWQNAGTGKNPDGSVANIGVYGGEFAWGTWNSASKDYYILTIEPEKNKIKKTESVSANLVIDNIKDIAAEDVRIKYDNTKLQFLGAEEVDGIKLVKNDAQPGELRFIVASKGEKNIANAKKALLKLNFKGIAVGEALVDVTKGRVSDGITIEKDLQDSECGQTTITIEELKDVNNSGEFTLLDLAIDARHMGKDPKSTELTKYNTDIVENNAIDEADLLQIGKFMLENPNYKF